MSKPNKRLSIGPLGKPKTDDVIRNREIMWAGWIEECADMQDRFVEGLLDLMRQSDD